jgi:hypothetical protein
MRGALLAAGVLCCIYAPASQARGVVATPVQLGLVGKPGTTVSGVIRVASPREEPNFIKASIVDFTKNEEGQTTTPPAGGEPRSCRPWLEVDKTEFTTPERGRVELRVTAKIPAEATGSYWTLVQLEAVPSPKASDKGIAVAIVPSVAIPVIVTVLGTERRALALAGTLQASVSEGAVECSVLVENSGNAAVIVNGAFALEKPSGRPGETVEIASADLSPVTSLPGTKLRVRTAVPWTGGLDGLTAHAYLRYGPGAEETLTASLVLEGLPPVPPAARKEQPPEGVPTPPDRLAPLAPAPPPKPSPPDAPSELNKR